MLVVAGALASAAFGVTPASAGVMSVTFAGGGEGTVTSSPAGIECSNTPGSTQTACSHDFGFSFETATLTANPAPGWAFRSWSSTGGGTCSGDANPCTTDYLFFDQAVTATFLPAPEPPTATTGAVSDVVFPSAKVHGSVNPDSDEFPISKCYFEFGLTTEYGEKAKCTPPSIGSGADPVTVSASIGVLQGNQTYHYRLVAVNGGGIRYGDDQTFTSGAAPADDCLNAAIRAEQGLIAQRLPDCMAYELVSPKSTAGQDPFLRASDPTGSDVLFRSGGGFSDVENLMNLGTTYRAVRTADGWETEALGGPPAASFPEYGEIDWTADWWKAAKPRTMWQARPVGSPAEYAQSMVGVKGGPWVPLSPSGETQVAATDANLNGVLLAGRIRPPLTDGSVDTREPTLNSLTVSYRQPDGSLDLRQVARQGNASLFPECNMAVGTPNGVKRGGVDRDGLKRIIFTTEWCSGADKERVWVSEPFSSAPDAFDASAPQCVNPCGPPQPVGFAGASLDTERVFMTTSQQLVDADADTTTDLYEYNFRRSTPDRLQLLTGNATPAEVLGVVTVSDSGSHVYFVARGDLADAVVRPGGSGPVAGSPNMYVRISGSAGEDPVTRFVGTLAEGDSGLWESYGQVAITPDGRFLTFGSAAHLTPDKVAGDSFVDVYWLNADTGELRRVWVSDPAHNGTNRIAQSIVGGSVLRISDYANYEQASAASVGVTADGDRVLFGTVEPLAPGDTNDAMDSFVWDATDGSVTMLSDGRDPQGVRAAAMAPNGESFFISTASRLAPQQTATSVGLYAIRADGGFSAPEPPPAPCGGDACQGPSASPPTPFGIGSNSVGGRGNVVPNPSVGVSKLTAAHGSAAKLKVRVSEAGRIVVAGSSIRRSGVSAPGAGRYTIKISLSPKAKKSLEKKGSLRVSARISFRAKGGQKTSKGISIIFKQAKKGGR